MKFFRTLILISLTFYSFLAQAEEEEIPAKSLVELLELVKEGKVVNSRVNSNREKQFLADRARQARRPPTGGCDDRRPRQRQPRLRCAL